MNQTWVLLLRKSKMKCHQSLCCTYLQMLQDNETEAFSLESESCFLGRYLRPESLAGPYLLLFPVIAPRGGSFHQFSQLLFPQVFSSVKIPGMVAVFEASVIQCPDRFSSLQFLQDLMRSSTCIVPTPFIALFCLSAIKGSINSYLAMSELPKGVFPIAIP